MGALIGVDARRGLLFGGDSSSSGGSGGGLCVLLVGESVGVEALRVEDLGFGHGLRVEQIAGLERRVHFFGVHFGQVIAYGRVMHARVRTPATVVGLDAQVHAQVHLEIRLGRADLAALRAHPFRLVQVNRRDVMVEIREVGELLRAVLAYRDVLFLQRRLLLLLLLLLLSLCAIYRRL